MFEKEENTVQIKSNISPIHISYNPWYGLKYSFRVANLDTVKGTQEMKILNAISFVLFPSALHQRV